MNASFMSSSGVASRKFAALTRSETDQALFLASFTEIVDLFTPGNMFETRPRGVGVGGIMRVTTATRDSFRNSPSPAVTRTGTQLPSD